jgi:hypothetical protein
MHPHQKPKKSKEQQPAYKLVQPPKKLDSAPYEIERPPALYSQNPVQEPTPPNPPGKLNLVHLPTPRELSLQSTRIAEEGYKWEKFRCTMEIAVTELDKKYKEYEKNPEKHPQYSEEWKKFWSRRYKELLADRKDPAKYDFKPEWIKFWTIRMKELHDLSIEQKKRETRAKLQLPQEGGEDKTADLKAQFMVQVPKSSVANKSPILIEDDDSRTSSNSRKKNGGKEKEKPKREKEKEKEREKRGRKRSSSFSDFEDFDDYDGEYFTVLFQGTFVFKFDEILP